MRIDSPVDSMKSFDFDTMDASSRYRFMVAVIVPRPIAFVSTMSAGGVVNLAPFSFFNGVSSEPPCVVFSITYKRSTPTDQKGAGDVIEKDTLRNIRETGEFVVNFVSEWIAEPMHQASADYPPDVDEMKEVGLTPMPSVKVRPPRVKESPIQWECRLEKLVDVGEKTMGASTLVIGRIVMMHVFDQALRDGRIDLSVVKPIARVAGRSYVKMGEVFTLWDPNARMRGE